MKTCKRRLDHQGKNFGHWEGKTYATLRFVPCNKQHNLDISDLKQIFQRELEKTPAAVFMGRLGGKVKSKAKTAAARNNAKLPRKRKGKK